MIGWNLILEHVLVAAVAARGVVLYTNDVSKNFVEKMTMDWCRQLHWDPYAVAIVLAVTIMACIG